MPSGQSQLFLTSNEKPLCLSLVHSPRGCWLSMLHICTLIHLESISACLSLSDFVVHFFGINMLLCIVMFTGVGPEWRNTGVKGDTTMTLCFHNSTTLPKLLTFRVTRSRVDFSICSIWYVHLKVQIKRQETSSNSSLFSYDFF